MGRFRGFFAFDFSAERGLCPAEHARRTREHFARVGLPTTLAELGLADMGGRLAAHMIHDKKRERGRTAFILTRGIGQAFVDSTVELAEVAAFLDRAP